MTRFVSTPIALFAGVLLTLATPALAQHADIQVQSLGGQIVTGGAIVSDDPGNSTREIDFGERVFGDNLGSNFRALNPGFNSLETGNTLLQSAGALGFTEGTEFEFDLLPFTIDSTLTNFAYWDGMGEVEFGPPPSDTTWTISVREGFGRIDYTVDGTDTVVPGGPVGVVSDLERVHEHQRIEVERLGGGELEGVYLVSMQLRVDGFDTSDPIFLAHYSFNTSSAIGDLAQDWVRDNYDALIGLDDQLPGDINADGAVDLLDLDILGANFGADPATAAQGDLNGDAVVDLLDLDILGANFGATAAASAVSVPEPTTAILVIGGVVAGLARRGRRA